MLKRCSSAALLLRNCFPEGATHPLAVPLQVHPPDVVIGSDGGSDFTKVEEEEEEVMLAESSDGFIMPDMKVDWLGSEIEVPSSTSSMEKLVRLDPEKLELVAREELSSMVEWAMPGKLVASSLANLRNLSTSSREYSPQVEK